MSLLGKDFKIQSKQVNRQIFAEIHCAVVVNVTETAGHKG